MEMKPLHHLELTIVLQALLVRGGSIGRFRYPPGESPIESYTQKVLKKMAEAPVATAAIVMGVTPVRDMGSSASTEAAKEGSCAIQ